MPVERDRSIWNGVRTLRIEFSDSNASSDADADAVTVESHADTVRLTVDGTTHELSRHVANRVADAIGDALESREEFVRTAGEHRVDGSYVVSRRGVDSTGNEKVFDSFRRLRRLYERLPAEFDAEHVGRTGITGSRRHMIVRHVAEHPAFECRTVSRNPLRVRKENDGETGAAGGEQPATAD